MRLVDNTPFECIQCGKCCAWEGVVRLTPEDIRRLASELEISVPCFVENYTKNGNELVDSENSKDCVFLKDNKCSVWNSKPDQCDKFPVKYTSKCPGFKENRSLTMQDYSTAVKAAKEKLGSSQDYLTSLTEDLYRSLNKGIKTAAVASSAIEAGIDSFLGEGTIKVASLDDLFSFDRVDTSHLIHKSTHDLWNIDTDKSGAVQITRLFDNKGEPIKG